jgi:uncharacterized protein YndB with AHSA1/START domain
MFFDQFPRRPTCGRRPAGASALATTGHLEQHDPMPQPGALELALTETLRASPERIFALMVDPAELVRWWGPHGFTTPAAELDLRMGGRYRLTMQPAGGDRFHLTGAYLEVDPPRRLSYTFRWEEPDPDDRETVVVVTLVPVDDGTELLLSQGPFATEERLALHSNGWTESLQRLRALVECGDRG